MAEASGSGVVASCFPSMTADYDTMSSPSLGFFCQRQHAPAPMPGAHSHADLEWNYLVKGAFRYRWRERSVQLPDCQLVLFWGGLPHRLELASRDCEVIVGVLPLARMLSWRLPRSALLRLTAGEMLLGTVDTNGDDRRMLDRWIRDLRGSRLRQELVESEVAIRFQRALLDQDHGDDVLPTEVVDLLRRLVEYHPNPLLSVEAVAQAAGLTPRRACDLLRATIGQTPVQFLRGYRIGEAQRLLIEGRSAADSGRLAGFGSIAAFYAAFHDLIGDSPDRWRRDHLNKIATGAGER